jgi:PKD repeat protein
MSMTYDASDGYVLLFGGEPYSSPPYASNSTWTFAGGVWSNITAHAGTPPTARAGMAMTYDARDGYVLAFGGMAFGSCPAPYMSCNETWKFHAGEWTQLMIPHSPGPSVGDPMVFDAADDYVVLFDSATLRTWTYANQIWTQLTDPNITEPYNAQNEAVTYDAAAGYVVLYESPGGGPKTPGSTWAYSHDNWTQLITTNVTPGVADMARMVYDPTYRYDLLYGGINASTNNPTASSDTWIFQNGNWTELLANSPPGPLFAQGLAFDQADNTTVLFGGSNVTGAIVNSTWVWSSNPLISNVTIATTPTRTDPGVPVNFSETISGGLAPYSYLWNFGEGNSSTIAAPSHAFANAGDFTVSLLVTDPGGRSADSSSRVSVSGPLTVTEQLVPNPTDVGVPTRFSANASGGSPPYTYSWRFGDGSNSSLVQPTHIYSTSGLDTASVWVNDSVGLSVAKTSLVRVNPPLTIGAVTGSPNPAILGQPVDFSSAISGGTAPFTYSWAFGDGGVGGNLSNITHIYTTNGPFVAGLTIVDAAGQVTAAFLNVTIRLTVSIGTNTSVGVAPLTVHFASTVAGGQPAYVYSWTFGDGGTSASPSPDHTYTSPRTYAVSLRVNDSGGHEATAFWNITVRGITAGGGTSSGLLGLPGNDGYYVSAGLLLALIVVAAVGLSRKSRWAGTPPSASMPSVGPYSGYSLGPRPISTEPKPGSTPTLSGTKVDRAADSIEDEDPLGDMV